MLAKKQGESEAKKQDESQVKGTVLFLSQEQIEKAVANYMRATMFKQEFKFTVMSVTRARGGNSYRVEFCDPALQFQSEQSSAD